MSQNNIRSFPLQSLPEALRTVVIEVQHATQAPIEMIVSSLFAATSHATQHAINVNRGGIVSPSSLSMAVIAESGERKSAVDTLVMKANRAHERRIQNAPQYKGEIHEAKFEIWELQRKEILARIKHAIHKGKDANSYQVELIDHLSKKPASSKPPQVIYADTTIEAMLQGLHQSWPSALLLSAEGASILAGPAMKGMDKFNVAWDGGDIPRNRMGESFTVQNARLTTAIMIQKNPFLAFLERKGQIARGIGFLARCLITYPRSTQGTRFRNGNQDTNLPHLALFHARIAEMLSTDDGKNDFKEVGMSLEGYTCWLNFYNRTEAELAEGRYLADIRDFGSKIADNAARLAANFHHYLARDGLIHLDCVKGACEIAEWYACEFKDLFGQNQIPQEQIDAQMLEEWLWNVFRRNNAVIAIPKQRIRTYGPNQLRNAGRLNGALWVLATAGKIMITKHGKTDVVCAYIPYFTGQWPQQPQQPPQQAYHITSV